MKEDESVPDMFHRMEVLANDLKALGEKVEDKYFYHKFLRCLPARFDQHPRWTDQSEEEAKTQAGTAQQRSKTGEDSGRWAAAVPPTMPSGRI